MDRCLYGEGKVVNSTKLHENVEFCVKRRVPFVYANNFPQDFLF